MNIRLNYNIPNYFNERVVKLYIIIHGHPMVADRCNIVQCCETIIANSELSLGTSLHLATLSHEHCPICVHFDCHFGTHVSVQHCVSGNTTVTRLLLTRCDDCRYISHCFINRTICNDERQTSMG